MVVVVEAMDGSASCLMCTEMAILLVVRGYWQVGRIGGGRRRCDAELGCQVGESSRVESRWSRTQQARIRRVQWHDPGQKGAVGCGTGVMVSMQWEGKHARTRFSPARFCMIAECLAGVLTCCFPSMHGPLYPKTGSGALPKTLVRPMSAVEGASWTGIAMATSGSFHQPRLSRAIHPESQARLSNVPILHLIASARARTASQALRFKVPGQQAKHPNPPLHPSLPSLAVVAIPLSSSYPPLPVSRRPLSPPWRPTTASLARCMFLPSVVTSCQGDWHEFHG